MSFSPADLPGLCLWLTAKAGTFADAGTTPAADGGTVHRWADQSGLDNHADQAEESRRGTWRADAFNGNPGIKLTAASYQKYVNTTLSQLSSVAGATVFLVVKNGSTAIAFITGSLLDIVLDPDFYSQSVATNSYATAAGQAGHLTAVAKAIAFRYDGSQVANNDRISAWRFGRSLTLTFPAGIITDTLGPGTGYTLGGNLSDDPYYINGYLFEVMVYSRPLSNGEITQVNDYIEAGWFTGLLSSVICCGDSLTISYPSGVSGGRSWPLTLGDLLGDGWVIGDPNVTAELAAPTARIAVLTTAGAYPVSQPYRPQNWLILWGGINDLQYSAPPITDETIHSNLTAMAEDGHAYGFRVAALTVTSRAEMPPPDFEARRAALNDWIVAQEGTLFEFVVDLRDTPLDTAGALNTPPYSGGDSVHFSQEGYDLVAQTVYDALVNYGAVSPPSVPPVSVLALNAGAGVLIFTVGAT